MLICPKCHHRNEDGSDVCTVCQNPFDFSTALLLAADPRALVGKTVNGKYEVLSILGEGAMGVVYKVRHLTLRKKNIFALKILHPKFSAQGNLQARFLREVETAMDLTHENVVQIRDFGLTEQHLLFYTMDYFPGDSLQSILRVQKRLPAHRTLWVARQVLLALAEAHGRGIVHRDLNPDNVLIARGPDDTERVRVLDFGIAKILAGERQAIESGAVERQLTHGRTIGTPKYMSPEQAAGEDVDGRSDLYSLGCMLYHMLAGQPPFSQGTARQILLCHLTAKPRRLLELAPERDIPPQVDELVGRLLEKDPRRRPESAEAALELVEGIQTVSFPCSLHGSPRSGLARRGVLATAACAAMGVAAWLLHPLILLPTEGAPRAEAASRKDRGGPKADPKPRCLRCPICGRRYAPGEKTGDMCHGEPLLEE